MPAPSCYLHPDVTAANSCGGCLKPICMACSVFEGGRDRCPSCVTRYWRAKRIRSGVFAGVVVVGLAAAAFLVLRAPSSGGSQAQGFDYGRQAILVDKVRGDLEREPCNRTKVIEYTQLLFSLQDWRGTIQASNDFIAKCGKFSQLRSMTYSAHIRLSEFDLAEQDASELIDSSPRNAGYWVWRALALQSQDAQDKALADFQQAFNLQPEQSQVVNQLVSAYERMNKPCEAVLVLRQHMQVTPSQVGNAELNQRLSKLEDAGKCDLGARGRAVVTLGHNGGMWVEPLVNGDTKGRFVVDTGATSVTLSQEFADKLGLDLTHARTIPLQTANGTTTARVALVRSIDLQGAHAENVQVTVTSGLPKGVDGLLGLSFLARFEMKLDARAGQLELSERKR